MGAYEEGVKLAQLKFPPKKRVLKRTKEWRKLRRRFVKETTTVNWNPTEKVPKSKVHDRALSLHELDDPPWRKIKFGGETFHAAEVVILVKPTPETDLRMFMSEIRNVRMYQDLRGGLLIRPIQASVESSKVQGGTSSQPTAAEGAAGSTDSQEKRTRNVPIVLKGKHGLNPAAEGSKRYYLIESMLEGGTPREIIDRGARQWSRATKKPKEKFGMVATPSNIREVYDIIISKLSKVGKKIKVVEKDGEFIVKEGLA